MRRVVAKLEKFMKQTDVLDDFYRYNPLYYGRILSTIKSLRDMSLEQRTELSSRLLNRSLRWAGKTAAGAGRRRDYSTWPDLEKESLRTQEHLFRRRWPLSRPAATSGTTGKPLDVWRSLRCVVAEQAFLDSALEPHGFDFRHARIAVLRGDEIKPPSERDPPFGIVTNNGKRLVLSSRHISPETTPWFVNAIREFSPHMIRAYASAVEALARHMTAQDLKINVPVVLSSSEMLQPGAWELIQRAFGSQIIDHYGLVERPVLAMATEPNKFYFNPAYGFVELRPVHEQGSLGDVKLAEIVATSFWNDAMPLIKYKTGDYVEYPNSYTPEDLKAVVLGIKPFLGIAGRAKDYLISPRDETLIGINHVAREVAHLMGLQVIQKNRHSVEILLLVTPDFAEADRMKVLSNASRVIPEDMEIELRVVSELRTQASGKTPFIIRECDQDNAR